MDVIGYYRSASGGDGRASINNFAAKHGIVDMPILCDDEGYSAFRSLQTLVKLGKVIKVIMPDPLSLGPDELTRLEHRLFFERNGVKLFFINGFITDRRRGIALNIKRFFSLITEFDADYGSAIPSRSAGRASKRVPPFGYRLVCGGIDVDPKASDTVKRIFSDYAQGRKIGRILSDVEAVSTRGKRFCNMTIKTVLNNDRYVGRRSKNGCSLKPVVTYDVWLKTRERYEKEYGAEKHNAPYCDRICSDESFSFFRPSGVFTLENARKVFGNGLFVDSDALEKAAERLISSVCTRENADEFYNGYVLPMRRHAEDTVVQAEAELSFTLSRFNRALSNVLSDDVSEASQNELETLADRRSLAFMRLRRARTELDVFSITYENVREVFSRAERIGTLSFEEKRFLSGIFIAGIRIKNGELTARMVSPADGTARKHKIGNTLYR